MSTYNRQIWHFNDFCETVIGSLNTSQYLTVGFYCETLSIGKDEIQFGKGPIGSDL